MNVARSTANTPISRRIRRFFLPSWTLGLYVAKTYSIRFLAMLIGLVTVLQMLDLLAVSDKILAAEGASYREILLYLQLRAPQLISQFTPFSALLATLITLATLNQHSEIIIMKASGLSAHRILFPLLVPCLMISGLHFWFNNDVVAENSMELQYWQDNAYAVNLGPAPEYTANPKMIEDNLLVIAGAMTRNGALVILDRVSVYARDHERRVTSVLRADFATWLDGQWVLYEARNFDVTTHEMTSYDTLPAPFSIPPDRVLSSSLNPSFLTVGELQTAIQNLRASGGNTDGLVSSLYHKFTSVLATLLMPLLGAVTAFGVHRAGALLMRAVIGMALGFAFFVADNFMIAMGQFGVAPPLMAAGAPLLLFASVGLALLFFSEE